jgi:hypothetical protein
LRNELRDLLKAGGKNHATEQPKAADVQRMISYICQAFGSAADFPQIPQVIPNVSENVKVKETQDKLDNLVNSQVTVHYTGPHVTIYNLHVSVSKGEHSKPPTRKSKPFGHAGVQSQLKAAMVMPKSMFVLLSIL